MAKTSTAATPYHKWRDRLRERFGAEHSRASARIDLASVMVGVIVIGVLGGIIAAAMSALIDPSSLPVIRGGQ